MGTETRTRSSHLWFLLCFAVFLSLPLLPSGGSVYTAVFFILVMDILKDKAVVVWKNLRESFCPGIVVSDLLVEIDSLRQGERTVEEYSEKFGVLWKKLEALCPPPVCTCGAKCFCSDALREERKKRKELKLVSFLKGLNHRSRIMLLEGRLPSLNKDYDSVAEEAPQMETVSADRQSQSQPPSTLKLAIIPEIKPRQEVREVQKLNRSIHPHPLTLKLSGAPYKYSGYLELGLGSSYCCETDNCNYILHEDYDSVVEEAAQMEMVSAYQQSKGVKQNQSQPPFTLKQAIIPKIKPPKEVKEVQKLNRSIHPHPLTLKPSGAPYKCSGCLELGLGPSYCCETDNCNYILHEDCANVVANNSLVFHRFFKESNFMFYKKKPDDGGERFCDACGNDVLGFVYHCDTTGKDLHPCCLKLKDSVSDEGRRVTLNLCETVPKKCEKCKGKKVENNIKGWSYVSSDEKYCFHVSCVKGLILEKLKEGYFSEDKMSLQRYDKAEILPLTGNEMVKAGRSSKRSGKIQVFIKIATVALKLIVSVIFGDPSSFILSALGAISAN